MPSERSDWRITKTEAVARRGMVTSEHPLASEAGVEILREGGNAVDAAVATAFALGVVDPFSSGVGGICGIVIRFADGRTSAIDGSTAAPRGARPDMFELALGAEGASMYGWPAVKDDANVEGWRAVAVPGETAALCHALERHGSLPRARVLEPAIRLARAGFDLDWYVALCLALYAKRLWQNAEAKRIFYGPGGVPLRPPVGTEPSDRLVQPDLARTLEAIARDGPEVLYRGELARAIAEDSRRNDGLLSLEDLGAYRVQETAPLVSLYRGHEVQTSPGLSGGPTMARALATLAAEPLVPHAQGSAASLHRIAGALRDAFQHRFSEMADTVAAPASHTTHLNVVDAERNLVSLTATLGQGFGSGVVPRGTGIVLVDGMTWFDPVPGHVNSIAPLKRILWAGAPSIVVRDAQPLLAAGAPGARKIISAVLQTIVNVVDYGDGPHDAVNRPRVHCEGEETLVDTRIPEHVRKGLSALGHRVVVREETLLSAHFARPNAILVDHGHGVLRGGVDDLKPAQALGLD